MLLSIRSPMQSCWRHWFVYTREEFCYGIKESPGTQVKPESLRKHRIDFQMFHVGIGVCIRRRLTSHCCKGMSGSRRSKTEAPAGEAAAWNHSRVWICSLCDVKGPLGCQWKVGKSPQGKQTLLFLPCRAPQCPPSAGIPGGSFSSRSAVPANQQGFYLTSGLCCSARCSKALQKWSGRSGMQRVICCLPHMQCIFIQINPGWQQLIWRVSSAFPWVQQSWFGVIVFFMLFLRNWADFGTKMPVRCHWFGRAPVNSFC